MMPDRPMMGGGAGGSGATPPGGEGGGLGEGPSPDTIKRQLVTLLTQAKKMAEANGVNFSEVVSAVEGNKSKADVPLPRPPSPSY